MAALKDNIPWFPHATDTEDDARYEALIATYGFEGYGRYMRLKEILGRTDGCRLDLGKKLYFNQLAGKLRMTPAELAEFLEFLGDPEQCGLVHKVVDKLCIDEIDDAHDQVSASRESARKRQARRRSPEQPECHGEQPEDNTEVPAHNATEQSRAEQSRIQAAAAGEEFRVWLLEQGRGNPGIRSPRRFADAVLAKPDAYPDLVDEFLASLASRSPPAPPHPDRCDVCGGTQIRVTIDAAMCTACGRLWTLEQGSWVPDPETGRASVPAHRNAAEAVHS